MSRTFHDLLDRDARLVFIGGPASGFAQRFTNGSVSGVGHLDDRYVTVLDNGFEGQRKVKVLRIVTGEGGTIAVDTILTVEGVPYRVVDIQPVAPDRRFTDYHLSGGVA